MSEEEIIIITKPRAARARTDFVGWHLRWSTWLGVGGGLLALLGDSLRGAAQAFIAMPAEWRALFPDWLGSVLVIAGVALGFLVPIATSLKQRRFQPKDDAQ